MLAQAKVVALDSTHLLGGRVGTGRRAVYQLVVLSPQGQVTVAAVFFVKSSSGPMLSRALAAIQEFLCSRFEGGLCPAVVYIDDHKGGRVHPSLFLCTCSRK